MTPLRGVLGAALLYLAAAGVLLAPALFQGEVVSAGAHFLRSGPFDQALRDSVPEGVDLLADSARQFQPWLRFAADAWARDRELPLWKPTALCGAPFLGNGQSSLLFPTQLVAIWLGAPDWVPAAQVLLRLVGGALAAYLLARHLQLSWLAALLTGLVFGFGGFQRLWLLHPHTQVSMLLPLLLLAADRVAQAPRLSRVALLATLVGLQHLGGHPATLLHCQALALVLGCVRAVSALGAIGWPGVRQRLGGLLGAFGLGTLLGAVQLLPLLESIAASDALRARSAQQALTLAAHPIAICIFVYALLEATLALRRLARDDVRIGRSALALCGFVIVATLAGLAAGLLPSVLAPLSADWFGGVRNAFGPQNYIEQNGAFAGAALALALGGLLLGRERGLVRTAGVCLLLGWLASAQAPLLDDLLGALPGFSLAVNGRLSLVALLAIAVLAGIGLDALGRARARDGRRLLAAGLACGLGLLAAVPLGYALGLTYSSHLRPRAPTEIALRAGLLPLPVNYQPTSSTAGATAEWAVGGWFQSGAAPRQARLFYADGDQGLDVVPNVADPELAGLVRRWQANLGAPIRPDLPVWVFHAKAPRSWLPPDPIVLRLRISTTNEVIAWSSPLLSATVETGAAQAALPLGSAGAADLVAALVERPFPMRPAPGRASLQLLLLLATLIGCAGLSRAGVTGRALGRGGLVASCALSLWTLAPEIPPTLPASLEYASSPTLTQLAERLPPEGRLITLQPHSFAPEIPTAYGLADVLGYDALYPSRVTQLVRAATDVPGESSSLEYLPARRDIDLALLGMMSVRIIADATALDPPLPALEFSGALNESPGKLFTLAENPHFLPRARLVHAAVTELNEERAFRQICSSKFPRARLVQLNEPAGPPSTWSGPVQPEESRGFRAERAEIVIDRPDRVGLELNVAAPGWLVLSDTHASGWLATVDGERRPVLRANYAFRAVAVEPGDRYLEFRYEPLSVRLGATLSLVAGLLLLAAVAWPRPGAQPER
ncbi:MAG: hypothetical protein ACT4PU_04135 [Planctomycetota bacterium]